MITFVVNAHNKKLEDAARLAQNFFKQLELKDLPSSFTHTDKSTMEVFAEIVTKAVCLPDRHVIVETYRPKWPWSKVIGYTLPSKPNYIFVNVYMLSKLQVADYVGNFTHEFMHTIGFKHKTNNPSKYNNLSSVPYAMGALAEAWARSLEFEENNQMSMGV